MGDPFDDFYPDDPGDWGELPPPDEEFPPEPLFLGRADLLPSGELWADVYTDSVTGDYSLRDVSYDSIDQLLGRDASEGDWVDDHATSLPNGFDSMEDGIRGPFPDSESVHNFLQETGLWWADVYYDPELDEYWIDVENSP